MKKRILSLLLAAVFLCALMGVPVQAAGEEPRKLVEIHAYWDDDEPSVTRLHYDEGTGLLERISFSGFGYEREDIVFTYDGQGHLTRIHSGDKEKDFYSYINLELQYGAQGRLETWKEFSVIYMESNGQCVYADSGKMIRATMQLDYPMDCVYFYDADGRVSEVEETYLSFENPITTKVEYYYDDAGRISQKTLTDSDGDREHYYYFYDYQGFVVVEGPYGITARYDVEGLSGVDPYVREMLWDWNLEALSFSAYDDAELIAQDGYLTSITGTINQGRNETHVEFLYEPELEIEETVPPTEAPAPEETAPATEAPAQEETVPATEAPAPVPESTGDKDSGGDFSWILGTAVIAAGAYLLGTRKKKE